MEIQFRHPRTNKILVADLSPQCTGREALQALMSAEDNGTPFLTQSPGEAYDLVHEQSRQSITPNMTFAQAGVTNGDTIGIVKAVEAARASRDAHMKRGGMPPWKD